MTNVLIFFITHSLLNEIHMNSITIFGTHFQNVELILTLFNK